MKKSKMLTVTSIAYSEVKKGDYVKIEGFEGFFTVVPHGQTIHLIPIDLKAVKRFNIYDINKPNILDVYDGKNGDCKLHRLREGEAIENENI